MHNYFVEYCILLFVFSIVFFYYAVTMAQNPQMENTVFHVWHNYKTGGNAIREKHHLGLCMYKFVL